MATRTIEVPVLQETETGVRFVAEIEGVTAILMHKPNLQVSDGTPKKVSKKRIPTPEEEASAGCYRFDDGRLYIPALWVQRNMIEAGKQFKNPQNVRQTMKTIMAASIIPPSVEGFPIYNGDGEPISEYEIDTRRAVVQRAAVMRSRPLIATPWTTTIEFGFDPDPLIGASGADLTDTNLLSAGEVFANALRVGGSRLGLGDYRPEKSGPFGKFALKRLHVERDED